MSMLATALAQVADHAAPESLETFRSHIDPEWIERALTVTARPRYGDVACLPSKSCGSSWAWRCACAYRPIVITKIGAS